MIEEINNNNNSKGIVYYISKTGQKKPLKNLKYIPMVRISQPPVDSLDDDDDDKKKVYEPYERVKVKLNTEWVEGIGPNDPRNVLTKIYTKDNPEEPEENTSSVSEFEKYFAWNCTAQHALMLNKFWIKRDTKECSFAIKSLQINITDSAPIAKSVSVQFSQSLFANNKVNINNTKEAKKEVNKDEDDEEDDDEDNDNEDDEDDDDDDEDEDDDNEDDNKESDNTSEEESKPVLNKSSKTNIKVQSSKASEKKTD